MAGFKIHKYAVLIECSLNNLSDCARGKRGSEIADIAIIYDRPISFVYEISETIATDEYQESDFTLSILHMKVRYTPFVKCVLSQLDEVVCKNLCSDLQALMKGMNT